MTSHASPPAEPIDLPQRYVATAWPSVCVFAVGRLLGRGYAVHRPGVYIFTPGNLLAVASIPIAIGLYLIRFAPFLCRRYVLTDRRVMIAKGITKRPGPWIEHDTYEEIVLDVLPGQAWFHAADLVFRNHDVEVFRLPAVAEAEGFRRTILEVREAYRQLAPLLARSA